MKYQYYAVRQQDRRADGRNEHHPQGSADGRQGHHHPDQQESRAGQGADGAGAGAGQSVFGTGTDGNELGLAGLYRQEFPVRLHGLKQRRACDYLLSPCAKKADGELPNVFLNMAEKADWLA